MHSWRHLPLHLRSKVGRSGGSDSGIAGQTRLPDRPLVADKSTNPVSISPRTVVPTQRRLPVTSDPITEHRVVVCRRAVNIRG